jgi:transcriptional regulator with XRE-family HTH domain
VEQEAVLMAKLGKLLTRLRERSPTPTRNEAALRADISAEHLRNIEADKSRPSPEVLSRLLALYDQPEHSPLAWVYLAEALLPSAVAERVEIRRKETP